MLPPEVKAVLRTTTRDDNNFDQANSVSVTFGIKKMNVFRCYTREELNEFMLGKLTVPRAEEFTEHLDHCSTCEDTVIGLEKASDTLVNLLAGSDADAAPAAYQKNPDYDRAATAAQQVINSWMAHTDSSPQRSVDQQKIGDYEIIQTLARGGMGSVFRARHARLEKEVAIKILPERKMQSPDAIARFSREMKIIGQMSHPTMVAATDAGATDGIHYLVMELVDGFDLGKLVGRCGPLAVADACELIRQSALGIQYAHEQDVVHRDVKPSNLMLATDSKVKVLDLGLATLGGLTGTVDELTTVGQLMGTLDYMAPEQCGNSQPVGALCDVYGLGATLYKLIAGVAPYSSPENDTPLKKLRAMATCEPTPIDERVTGLPEELVSIINRCLADLPKDRFDSAADLAAALEPLCSDHDLPGLLQRANSVTSQPNTSVPLLHNPGSAQKQLSAGTNSEAKPAAAGAGNSRRWISTAIGFASAGFAILAGIVIYLHTTAGQLIIESEVEDVRVTVMKNERPTKDVQVEQGAGSTKLRAGEYQIVIESDSDQLEIENDKFVLRRGETVVAKITKRANDNSDAILPLDSDPTEHRVVRADSDKVPGEPTYNSRGIEWWIGLARDSSDIRSLSRRANFLKIVNELAPLVSDERKKEIVERHLDESKHEISSSFHASLAVSLAPLCDSEELFDKLFDHVSSRADPSILESSSPERFQVKMLQELKDGTPKKQAISIQWVEQKIKHDLEQQLSPEWKDVLLKRIDNVDQQESIMAILAVHFCEDAEVIEAIYKCVTSAEYSPTENPSWAHGHTVWVDHLLKAKPKDKVIPFLATQWLKMGAFDPQYFVQLAFSSAIDGPEDRRLIDQLNQVLLDSSWGLSLKGVTTHWALINEIRKVGDAMHNQVRLKWLEEAETSEGTKKTRLAALSKHLLPAIYKQFEFKFVDPQDTRGAEQATRGLHQEANDTIASLTGVEAGELCKGYDISHWAKAFASAKSESEKLEAIRNVYKLRESKNVPDDFALLIAQGVRGYSFDYVDFGGEESVQSLAISMWYGRNHQGLAAQFVASLGQLNDEDAMFAFWSLWHIEGKSDEVFEYAELYTGSDNYLLRSRAILIMFENFHSRSRSFNEKKTSLERAYLSVLEDESLSNRQKLRIFASCQRKFSSSKAKDEIKGKFIELVNQIEDPRELATVFSGMKASDHLAETIGSLGMDVIALKLLAKNPDYLHQPQQPLVLNCWITPEKEEEHIGDSNHTLFDLCLVKIYRSKNMPLQFLSKDQTDQVLANLEAVKKTSASDVQRIRLERIIEKIKSQSEVEQRLERLMKVPN